MTQAQHAEIGVAIAHLREAAGQAYVLERALTEAEQQAEHDDWRPDEYHVTGMRSLAESLEGSIGQAINSLDTEPEDNKPVSVAG